MTKRQPNEQREQKPNLFGLCRVASEEEVFNPQLLTLLTVGTYRTHLYKSYVGIVNRSGFYYKRPLVVGKSFEGDIASHGLHEFAA